MFLDVSPGSLLSPVSHFVKIETVMMTMDEFMSHFTHTGSGNCCAAKVEWYKLVLDNATTKDVDPVSNVIRIGISVHRATPSEEENDRFGVSETELEDTQSQS